MIMHKSNCIKCKAERSVRNDKEKTNLLICNKCNAVYYISTRKKETFPTVEVQKILSSADKYRAKKVYDTDITVQERENVRDTMRGKLFKFRHGNGRLEEREDGIFFVGRLRIDDGETKQIEVKTNVSIEEYILYLSSDPKKRQNN